MLFTLTFQIVFYTDMSVTNTGFDLDFDYVDAQHDECTKTKSIRLQEGVMVSLFLKQNFPLLNLIWFILILMVCIFKLFIVLTYVDENLLK